jgi:hypothetical protein
VTAILEANKPEDQVWSCLWNIVYYRALHKMEKTEKHTSSNTISAPSEPYRILTLDHELKVQMQWLINELQNPKAPQQTHWTCVKHDPLLQLNWSGHSSMSFYTVTKILLLQTKFEVIVPIKVLWCFHQIHCITRTSCTVLLIFFFHISCSNWKEKYVTKMTAISLNINIILHIIPTFSNTSNMLWLETDHNTRKSSCNK